MNELKFKFKNSEFEWIRCWNFHDAMCVGWGHRIFTKGRWLANTEMWQRLQRLTQATLSCYQRTTIMSHGHTAVNCISVHQPAVAHSTLSPSRIRSWGTNWAVALGANRWLRKNWRRSLNCWSLIPPRNGTKTAPKRFFWKKNGKKELDRCVYNLSQQFPPFSRNFNLCGPEDLNRQKSVKVKIPQSFFSVSLPFISSRWSSKTLNYSPIFNVNSNIWFINEI